MTREEAIEKLGKAFENTGIARSRATLEGYLILLEAMELVKFEEEPKTTLECNKDDFFGPGVGPVKLERVGNKFEIFVDGIKVYEKNLTRNR